MAGLRLTGLWIKKGQNGKDYFEGKLGSAILRVYVNDYKKTESQPDYVVYLSEDKEKSAYKKPQGPPATRPQAPAIRPPPRQAYVDHTRQTYEPPLNDGAPWPEAEDEPPFQMDQELRTLTDHIEHHGDVLARARDAYLRMEAERKTFESRLIDKASGKSIAERQVKAMAEESWLEFHVRLARLKSILEYQQDRLELLNKKWLGEYASLKTDLQAIRKQT